MKTIAFIIGILLISLPCYLFAQIDKAPTEQKAPKNERVVTTATSQGDVASGNDGGSGFSMILPAGNAESVYFPDDWALGTVQLVDGSVLESMRLRYNMYSQQMQFIEDGDTAAFAKPKELESINIGEYKFIYSAYLRNNESKEGYFEVLTEGKCQLLFHREITYHLIDDLDDGIIDDSYILEHTYYLKKEEKPAVRIHMDRKSVLSAFCDNQEKVKEYIKNNKIRFNNQEDMISVVNYYNSLPTSN